MSLAQNAIMCQAGLSVRLVFWLAQFDVFFNHSIGGAWHKMRFCARLVCQPGRFFGGKFWYYQLIGGAWHKMRFCARLVCQPGRFFGGKFWYYQLIGGAWHKMRFCARLVVSQVSFWAGEIWYYHPLGGAFGFCARLVCQSGRFLGSRNLVLFITNYGELAIVTIGIFVIVFQK